MMSTNNNMNIFKVMNMNETIIVDKNVKHIGNKDNIINKTRKLNLISNRIVVEENNFSQLKRECLTTK